MQRCAFLTLEDRSDFCIYDHLLFEPLARVGWQVQEIPWTAEVDDWSIFDAVVVRSTWDYQSDPQKFLSVLELIESQTRLFNSAAVCRWNLDKIYLQELESLGVPTVPTEWGTELDLALIDKALLRFSSQKLIVKPRIGANADDTYVLSSVEDESRRSALRVFSKQPFLLQPFLPSILECGEYSLFYFGGQLSHAILKQPAQGDFRVQEEHGGRITLVPAPEEIRAVADHAMSCVGESLLYGRVDVVRLAAGGAAVMELELIEPSLYFDQDREASERFVGAFLSMLR